MLQSIAANNNSRRAGDTVTAVNNGRRKSGPGVLERAQSALERTERLERDAWGAEKKPEGDPVPKKRKMLQHISESHSEHGSGRRPSSPSGKLTVFGRVTAAVKFASKSPKQYRVAAAGVGGVGERGDEGERDGEREGMGERGGGARKKDDPGATVTAPRRRSATWGPEVSRDHAAAPRGNGGGGAAAGKLVKTMSMSFSPNPEGALLHANRRGPAEVLKRRRATRAAVKRDYDEVKKVLERTAKPRGVLDPFSHAMITWDRVMGLCLLFVAIVTPFQVGFLETKLDALFVVDRLVDLAFVADILVNFRLAFLDPISERYVYDMQRIRAHYTRFWFWIDLVSVMPFDALAIALDDAEQLSRLKLLRGIRLLRLIKLLRMFKSARILARVQARSSFFLRFLLRSVPRCCVFFFPLVSALSLLACPPGGRRRTSVARQARVDTTARDVCHVPVWTPRVLDTARDCVCRVQALLGWSYASFELLQYSVFTVFCIHWISCLWGLAGKARERAGRSRRFEGSRAARLLPGRRARGVEVGGVASKLLPKQRACGIEFGGSWQQCSSCLEG